MSDFQRKLREHYESQALSERRVREILQAGAVAAARRRRLQRWWGLAAVLVLGGIGASVTLVKRSDSPALIARLDPVSSEAVTAAVTQFFSRPDYQLAQTSADVISLADWLQEQGAPAFTIPKNLRDRPSYGCQILEVGDQRLFLMCFFLDATAADSVDGMPIKREMVVTAADGTMMKKNQPLVHLIIVPRAALPAAPSPGTWVSLPAKDTWNFEIRAQDTVVYIAAGETTSDRLRALVEID
jgi:hypothetical protein